MTVASLAAKLDAAKVPVEVHATDINRALAIVETRRLPHLPAVISTAVACHPGWPLYVFAPPDVHEFLQCNVSGYHKVTLGVERMTTKEYSRLLLSEAFWRVFREQHVLVFQSDCVIVRAVPSRYFQFDYVGAVCGTLDPRMFVMNGGLSLRNTEAMLRALTLMDEDLMSQPEDVAFCAVLRRGGFTVPTMEECDRFAIESQGNPSTAIGIHGTDKSYAPPELIDALCRYT